MSGRTVWFPGHMAKGGRKLAELAEKLDLIVEVRDARAPFSTSSPLIENLARLKPVALVLSKKDLADSGGMRVWMEEFTRQKKGVWAFNLRKDSLEPLRKYLSRLAPPYRELRLAVVGIPNVGKSLFLNMLLGRSKAKVGGIPGVTRDVSWYRGSGFLVVDSPGILDPGSQPGIHRILSWLGCAKADVVGGYEAAALELIRFLRRRDIWNVVSDTWDIDGTEGASEGSSMEPAEFAEKKLATIGRRLGCLIAGGNVDMELAGRRLVDSFAAGKLGPVTLEMPGDPLWIPQKNCSS
jgi:ribosome biogenesis GTPase A